MKSLYLKTGTSYRITNETNLDLHKKLPAGNFVVKINPLTEELFLDQVESFDVNHKLYGDTSKRANRILNTFGSRDNSTGVLLNGEKGSGKTLLAKLTCVLAAKEGIPTIIINSGLCGDKFNQFIQSINQPCIVMFDEFEKVYDREGQEQLLTLLDGVFPSKKLFILTCNEKYRINDHMMNRPGRIFYMIDFGSLDIAFIKEYCNDNLNDKTQIDSVCNLSRLFDKFNFDMLKALIEEMNRYNELAVDAIEMLNAKPADHSAYNITVLKKGVAIPKEDLHTRELNKSPLMFPSLHIEYEYVKNAKKPHDTSYEVIQLSQTDLLNIDSKNDSIVYQQGDHLITFIKKVASEMSIKDYLSYAV